MIDKKGILLAAGLAVLSPLLAAGLAHAEEQGARCTVRIIHALDAGAAKGEPKIDPKIVRLRPYFSRPPFTAWHEFKMLEEKSLELAPKAPQTFSLPNGKQATLTYLEHLPAPGGKHRVRLQLQIGDPQKPTLNTVVVIDEGGVMLQAGQHYEGGLLVLGTSCEEAHAR